MSSPNPEPGFVLRIREHIPWGLAFLTIAALWSVSRCGFTNFDDKDYFTGNPQVYLGLSSQGVVWAFTTFHAANWHPLTWLSLMLDATLFGVGPLGPHLMNLALHVMNTLLLFQLLRRLTGAPWRSAMVAGLFGCHPLHVESVAWIAERKDLLSTWFGLLAVHFWVSAQAGTDKKSGSRAAALICYACSLLSKPMLVTLPLLLLLLERWPGGIAFVPRSGAGEKQPRATWVRSWLSKWPWFLLAAASCVVTIVAQQRGGAVRSLTVLPLVERFANAGVAGARYLGKIFWPVELAVFYPHPGAWPLSVVLAAALLILGLSGLAVALRSRVPYLFTGWFWFLISLLPVIGLVQVGGQALADRYMYVPSIGIFVILVWWAVDWGARLRLPPAVLGAVGSTVLLALAWRTQEQVQFWRDSGTLFRHALAVTPENSVAHNNLGEHLVAIGRREEAAAHFRDALRLDPTNPSAYDNLGFSYYGENRLEEAMVNYRRALELDPGRANTWNNLGSAYARRRDFTNAIPCYERALSLRPAYPEAHNNLAVALKNLGSDAAAGVHYREAIRLNPHSAEPRNNLANLLAGQGQAKEAIAVYRAALALDPAAPATWSNLAWVLAEQGDFASAVTNYEHAIQLQPKDASIHADLAQVLLQFNRPGEALLHYDTALTLQPESLEAKLGRGVALARLGRRDEARASLEAVLKKEPGNAVAQRELLALDAPSAVPKPHLRD